MNEVKPRPHRRQFLQSALLVDDRAFSHRRDPADEEPLAGDLVLEDPAEEAVQGDEAAPPARSPLEPEQAEPVSTVDDIDAQTLVEKFADLGVACATLAPRETIGPDRDRVLDLAANTDIVILDWFLRDPSGTQGDHDDQLHAQATNSRDLVREIVEQDDSAGGRLRLLCIYTGNRYLDDTLEQVAGAVREVVGTDVQIDRNRLTVTAPHLRVVLLAKTTNRNENVPRIDEARLPGRLVHEFQALARGLLRQVALDSLAAFRDNAHRLLLRFPDSLDAPFLSHRALVGPSDAEDWAAQLITDEIAVLAAGPAKDGHLLNPASVQQVIDTLLPATATNRRMLSSRTGTKTTPVDTALARRILKEGRRAAAPDASNSIRDALAKAASVTLLFGPGHLPQHLIEAAELDDSLAAVSCLARDPRDPGVRAPVLGLGSLLIDGETCYVCLQPGCDSVRLWDKPTYSFPLLPLTTPKDNRYDITAPHPKGGYRRLSSLSQRLRDLEQHSFKPDGTTGTVLARRDAAGAWVFDSTNPEGALTWAGDLRPSQAARCAIRLSQSAARLGLLESEYQRVWSV